MIVQVQVECGHQIEMHRERSENAGGHVGAGNDRYRAVPVLQLHGGAALSSDDVADSGVLIGGKSAAQRWRPAGADGPLRRTLMAAMTPSCFLPPTSLQMERLRW